MCGIVGYIGKRQGTPIVLEGLKALEYRGYDSAGIVAIDGQKGTLIKQVGRVNGLEEAVNKNMPKANLTIGHTRWATHGVPSLNNAHPHTNASETIFVVHNGIIENYLDIKSK